LLLLPFLLLEGLHGERYALPKRTPWGLISIHPPAQENPGSA
jgi:hypothetical protein